MTDWDGEIGASGVVRGAWSLSDVFDSLRAYCTVCESGKLVALEDDLDNTVGYGFLLQSQVCSEVGYVISNGCVMASTDVRGWNVRAEPSTGKSGHAVCFLRAFSFLELYAWRERTWEGRYEEVAHISLGLFGLAWINGALFHDVRYAHREKTPF